MTAERLNELMHEQYSYIGYDEKLAKEFLDNSEGITANHDKSTVAWLFADYLLGQELAEYVEE